MQNHRLQEQLKSKNSKKVRFVTNVSTVDAFKQKSKNVNLLKVPINVSFYGSEHLC